jgi:hypothetical protein
MAEQQGIDLSGDGGVLKTIIVEGTGTDTPPSGSDVTGTSINSSPNAIVPAASCGAPIMPFSNLIQFHITICSSLHGHAAGWKEVRFEPRQS